MQKILKTGNSLAVVIPSQFVKNFGLKAGNEVKVLQKPEKGEILYKFSGSLQLPLSENIFKKKQ